MPLEFDRKKAQLLIQRKTLAPLFASNERAFTLDVGGSVDAEVRWSPLAFVETQDDVAILPPSKFAAIVAPAGSVGSGSAFSYRPRAGTDDVERIAITSLGRTLQRKKKQFDGKNEPAVLVLKSAHHWLPPAALLDLLQRRVWSNRRYGWLAAACVIFPRESFAEASPANRSRLLATINENAVRPATPCLKSLLAGEQCFHLRDGKFENA